MSNVTLEGNIGKEVTRKVINTSDGEMTIVEFSLAASNFVNGKFDKENALWVSVKAVGDFGEDVYALLGESSQSRRVVASGILGQETWEKDGEKRSKLVLTAKEVGLSARFASKNSGSSSSASPSPVPSDNDDDEAF